jgi:hypothetical protein
LYDRYYRAAHLIRSTFIATLVLLAIYALLPERFRFSRGIVVFGALLAFLLISIMRALLVRAHVLYQPVDKITKPYILVAGSEDEVSRLKNFLEKKGMEDKIIGRIAVNGDGAHTVSGLSGMKSAADSLNAQEIIFCAGHLSYKKMIEQVELMKGVMKARFFAGSSIVGSDDKTTRGQMLGPGDDHRLSHPALRRLKRLIDIVFAGVGLFTFPVQFFLVKKPVRFLKHCLQVLWGHKSWVGYILPESGLPPLRSGIIHPNGINENPGLPEESLAMIDYWYAHDYEPLQDIKLLLSNYRDLGC